MLMFEVWTGCPKACYPIIQLKWQLYFTDKLKIFFVFLEFSNFFINLGKIFTKKIFSKMHNLIDMATPPSQQSCIPP